MEEKEHKLLTNLGEIIQRFNETLMAHLPALTSEVNQLIAEKSTDANMIEHYLDTLLSLSTHGIGEKLFVQLLDYYKTIDAEGALFYWNEYDKEEDDE